MNASMNDTHNLGKQHSSTPIALNTSIFFLAWKLTQVLRGWANISLLQTVSEPIFVADSILMVIFSTSWSDENTHRT